MDNGRKIPSTFPSRYFLIFFVLVALLFFAKHLILVHFHLITKITTENVFPFLLLVHNIKSRGALLLKETFLHFCFNLIQLIFFKFVFKSCYHNDQFILMSLNWSTFVKTHLNFFNPLQINDRLVNQRNKIFFNRFLVFLKKKEWKSEH